MKKILGLDLGTNSIGWAVVNEAGEIESSSIQNIEAAGSRIIPMSADITGAFERGNSVSQTEERTRMRGMRRLRERFLLRRERLHRVMKIMNFLPEHYAESIGAYGKFKEGLEPKIEWKKNENGKYEFIFQESFNQMLACFNAAGIEGKIPADWCLYYLRKKALTQKIEKEELAWILLNFNQKRGYNQLRDEEEEDHSKKEEYKRLKIVRIEDSGEKKGKDTWYYYHLENGLIYKRSSESPMDWLDKEKDFIVTTQLEKDGSIKRDKDGDPKISIRAPKEDDWGLLKKRTEADIEGSQKTVGEFIFDSILSNPNVKVIGQLVRTIERKFYRKELKQIPEKQKEFHKELNDRELYNACLMELYPNNISYRNSIASKDFVYLLAEDIILYQRPLKSKKHLIDNCPYEKRYFTDAKTRERQCQPIKCIAKSHPLFQEFRIWQFISNLKIYSNDGHNKDVTGELIPDVKAYTSLFDFLNSRAEITQEALLKYFNIKKKEGKFTHRWNYVEDKAYPCHTTRAKIAAILTTEEKERLSDELLIKIWHLLYSVKTKEEMDSVISDKKIGTNGIYDELRANFSDESIKKLTSVSFNEDGYGAYSEKAIKKLLSVMRIGKYWSESDIDPKLRERFEKILTGEYDENINYRAREKSITLQSINDFQGLPLWLACYVVYGRHSEASEISKWNTPEDIDTFLANFKQHSLCNPIVEQVVMETLRTVRDIWKKVGHIDEIHIELGRNLKQTKEQRIKDTQRISQNENTNQRIRNLLREFMDPDFNIDGVRPFSPSQHEILKIYEEGALQSTPNRSDEINRIIDKLSSTDAKKYPSKSDILKYKAWLEQKYRSPYTGQPIPLSRLFTHEYEIEHIIPQSRYFDDSFLNKVICEAEVNRLKNRQLGYEFIKNHHGEVVTLTGGKTVTILSVEAYESFVKNTYTDHTKVSRLLLEDIPDEFINRQMNDTRYISRYISSLLSHIVREEIRPGEYEQETISKHLIPCNGSITTRLKKDWGLDDVWNRIVLPRFQRMNEISNSRDYTRINQEGHEIPNMPEDKLKGFNKKRIDHRHHAMDAIVIACASRSHVHLLNNEAAKSENQATRHQLSRKLRRYEKTIINGKEREVAKEFIKPWPSFSEDVQKALMDIIVSFKQNIRVINKATNTYQSYRDENGNLRLDMAGNPIKGLLSQKSHPDWWAIRKSLHKDTVFGKVRLQEKKPLRLSQAMETPEMIVDKELRGEIKKLIQEGYNEKQIKAHFKSGENKDNWAEFNPNKIDCWTYTDDTFATRTALDESFDSEKIEKSVTDSGIQKILLAHLKQCKNDPKIAFSPEGIEQMNANIQELNGGKPHMPILKVRKYEHATKFAIGQKGNKKDKFVEAAKGTNLYFAIYVDAEGKRIFETIGLNEVATRMKQHLSPVPEKNANSCDLLFWLSPNDLVYLPTEDEIRNQHLNTPICKDRIYKMVSATGPECMFIPINSASPIVDKLEFSKLNKIGRATTGEMIKDICIPLKVDRTGQIVDIKLEYLPQPLAND